MGKVVRIFKSNFVEARFTSLIVSLFVLVMRTALFYTRGIPETEFTDTSFAWRYIAGWFSNPFISFIAGTAFVFLIAWLISDINNRFSLIRTRTSLPFTAPLFLFSLHPYFLKMTPDYACIVFALAALYPLLQSYQKTDTQVYAFRSAILIGIAGVFQIYALVLLPLWWRGEGWMRGGHFRPFFSSVFGALLVYVSIFSVFILYDDVVGFIEPFKNFTRLSLPEIPDFSMMEWVAVGLVFGFFVFYMFFSINTYTRDKVLTLSIMRFKVFLLIILMIFQAVYWRETLFFFSMSIALVSYLIAYFYSMTVTKTHIYGAYAIIALLIGFYFTNYFSFLPFA